MNLPRPLIAVGLVAISCVAGALIPFIVFMHDLPIATTSSEPWAHFGSYLGGVLGPLLAVLNLFSVLYIALRVTEIQQSQMAQKRLTIDLFAEWHQDAMHNSTTALEELIARAEHGRTPIPMMSEYETKDPANQHHALRVYRFFHKCAVLIRATQLDLPLFEASLGETSRWWVEHFISPILARESSPPIIETLRLIQSAITLQAHQGTQAAK